MTETTRPAASRVGPDGLPMATTHTSPVDNTVRTAVASAPTTVVPVIFVPGIMGSNLRNVKSQESIWNTNSVLALLFQWAFRSSATRQTKLNFTKIEVDDGGAFIGRSATVPNADIAQERGWGTTSKAFYGGFLRWLDNELNKDFVDDIGDGQDDGTGRSPWEQFADRAELATEWNAEKSFQVLTAAEAKKVWLDFFCPVHACGYNWCQSNGDSGKDLANKINEIIAYWNNPDKHGGRMWKCEQVILVTHSMGGLVGRAAAHAEFGNAAAKILGIVHGEMPANGAAAAYHHVRSGYDGITKIVLGWNAAQVTAIFANSPGAMELLPNHQYPAGWLKAVGPDGDELMQLPVTEPYDEIYRSKDRWWRLVDPRLIDPAGMYSGAEEPKDPWDGGFRPRLGVAEAFHRRLGSFYHPQTHSHYGADSGKFVAYNNLVWCSEHPPTMVGATLQHALVAEGTDPVVARSPEGANMTLEIAEPMKGDVTQAGDGTVPASSGGAPKMQGGENVRQSFRLSGYEHQDSYNDTRVRLTTLYSIGKLLQQAKVL